MGKKKKRKWPGPGMHEVTCPGCKRNGFVYLEFPLPPGELCSDCVKKGGDNEQDK